MDQYSLKTFLSMAHLLHFGRAGQECGLSPSAVSRTISRLEEELGRQLFIRDNRSVAITDAGREFRIFALETMEAWERLKLAPGGEAEGMRGEIRIYSSVAASYTVLTGMLSAFRVRYPNVHIRLQTGDPAEALEQVRNSEIDITVAALPASLPPNLAFKPVTVTPLLFIAPTLPCEAASLVERRPIPWSRVPMVLPEVGLSRKRADTWFRAAKVKANIYAEVSGHEAIVSMVRLGCGVGIVPKLVLERFVHEGEIRILGVDPPLEPYIVGLCAQERRLDSPVIRAFWDIAL
jgi:LysR family transcriptional regulator, positive regulator for ilvC